MSQTLPIEVLEAIEVAKKCCKDHYAQSYLGVLTQQSTLEGRISNLEYALNNMQHWRGTEARLVKIVFRNYLAWMQSVI